MNTVNTLILAEIGKVSPSAPPGSGKFEMLLGWVMWAAMIGSIIGIGFPAWTGGTRQYAKNYAGPGEHVASGYPGFVARAEELAAKYGERFAPTESLKKLAAEQG